MIQYLQNYSGKNGELVDRTVGALPKPELEAKINNLF